MRRRSPLPQAPVWALLAAAIAPVGCRANAIEVVGAAPRAPDAAQPAPLSDAGGEGEDAGLDAAEAADPPPPPDGASDLPPLRPEPGLMGYWPLDEGAGTRVADASGNGNHGALERTDGAQVWAPGRVGGALHLSGPAWARIPSSPSIDAAAASNAFTIAAWIWTASYTPMTFNFVVSRQIGSTPFDDYGLALLDGRPTMTLVTQFTSAPARVPLRAWVHLAVTCNGQMCSVYVDGALANTERQAHRVRSDVNPLVIGGNANDGGGRPNELFDGFVDEVRLYDRALTPEELAPLAAGDR